MMPVYTKQSPQTQNFIYLAIFVALLLLTIFRGKPAHSTMDKWSIASMSFAVVSFVIKIIRDYRSSKRAKAQEPASGNQTGI